MGSEGGKDCDWDAYIVLLCELEGRSCCWTRGSKGEKEKKKKINETTLTLGALMLMRLELGSEGILTRHLPKSRRMLSVDIPCHLTRHVL